ncbi:hypothetical protein FRC02_000408 [Tulasnella sp. 418]|nr:hypothetical protein FRC02_000408 [Tulasnella sp. 418]
MYINELPVELLCSMFMLSTKLEPYFCSVEGSPWYLWDNRTAVPYLLSQVCRYWRDIATGYPALWGYINITSYEDRALERVSMTLERSGNHPLDIVICDSAAYLKHVDKIKNLVIPHASRWRSFRSTYFINSDPVIHIFLKQRTLGYTAISSPLLEVLRIGEMDYDAVDPEVHYMQRFYTPRLRRLDLSTSLWEEMPQWLDWGDLTHFTIGWACRKISPRRLGWIINPMFLLEELDLRRAHLDWKGGHRHSQHHRFLAQGILEQQIHISINPPNLRTLRLGGEGKCCGDAWEWLSHFRCPLLSRLQISQDRLYISRENAPRIQMPLDEAQFPSLKTLRLCPDPEGIEGLLHCTMAAVPFINPLVVRLPRPDSYTTLCSLEMMKSPDISITNIGEIHIEVHGEVFTQKQANSTSAFMKKIGRLVVRKMPNIKVKLSMVYGEEVLGNVVDYNDSLPDGGLSECKPVKFR